MNTPPHRKKCGSVLCRYATPTTDGEEVVHAISRAFLAESEASGRVLTMRDRNWWARFGELEEYKREFGDCNVPQRYGGNPQLGLWVFNQRQRYQQMKLSSERIEALESMGFEWARPRGGGRKPDNSAWWKRFAELEEYKQEHGDCNVPYRYKANPQLGLWVRDQRANYKNSRLADERIQNLNAIGFVWDSQEAAWEEKFAELVAYKEMHGDTLVPIDLSRGSDNKYYDLAQWVHTQRTQYRFLQEGKHSHLTDERIQKLNRIGFVWDAQEAAWEEKFAELVEFKAAHGHTDVPKSWENQQLFWWVSVQRREYRKLKEGKMTGITEERKQRLDGIGFEWRSKKTYQWKIRLGELRDFYNENGVVPIPKTKHLTLYSWVWNQKKEYNKYVRGEKTNMDEKRINDLERIGFFDI